MNRNIVLDTEIQNNIVANITTLRHYKRITQEQLIVGIEVSSTEFKTAMRRKRIPLWLLVKISNYFDVLIDDMIKNSFEFTLNVIPRKESSNN